MLSNHLYFLTLLLVELSPGLHVAGGAVKDCLLGRPHSDVDIVFPPEAAGIAARFAGKTGGTRIALRPHDPARAMERVVVGSEGNTLIFDFTALRGSSIEGDLAGRDFTVTAMALPLDAFVGGDLSRLVDPFGGREAIREKQIRVLSDDAFRRDPLRLLRAFRLAAELGFTIDGETLEKIARDGALLEAVSGERVRDEVFRILEISPCHPTVEAMDCAGLLGHIFPESSAMKGVKQGGYHALDVWSHTLLCLKELEGLIADLPEEFGDGAPDFEDYLAGSLVRGRSRAALLKLAIIFHDSGKPATRSFDAEGQAHFFGHAGAGVPVVDAICNRLRLSRAEEDYVRLLVLNHMHLVHLTAQPSRTARSVMHFFRKYGEDYRAFFLLFMADTRATAGPKMTPERVSRIRGAVTELLRLYETEVRARLASPALLTGRDLAGKLGLAPGPLMGEILRKVEEARLAGRVVDRDSALEFAGTLLKKDGR